MEKMLTREAKVQLASSLRRRYQAAPSRAKKQILSEFVAVSGYHPKYAIHLLNAAESSAPARRGRGCGPRYMTRRRSRRSLCCGKPRIVSAVRGSSPYCGFCCHPSSDTAI